MGVFIPPSTFPVQVKEKTVITKEKIRRTLKKVDRNRDDRVSEDELKEALKILGSRWPAFRAILCFQHADTNHDRQISGQAEIDKLVDYIFKCYT